MLTGRIVYGDSHCIPLEFSAGVCCNEGTTQQRDWRSPLNIEGTSVARADAVLRMREVLCHSSYNTI